MKTVEWFFAAIKNSQTELWRGSLTPKPFPPWSKQHGNTESYHCGHLAKALAATVCKLSSLPDYIWDHLESEVTSQADLALQNVDLCVFFWCNRHKRPPEIQLFSERKITWWLCGNGGSECSFFCGQSAIYKSSETCSLFFLFLFDHFLTKRAFGTEEQVFQRCQGHKHFSLVAQLWRNQQAISLQMARAPCVLHLIQMSNVGFAFTRGRKTVWGGGEEGEVVTSVVTVNQHETIIDDPLARLLGSATRWSLTHVGKNLERADSRISTKHPPAPDNTSYGLFHMIDCGSASQPVWCNRHKIRCCLPVSTQTARLNMYGSETMIRLLNKMRFFTLKAQICR